MTIVKRGTKGTALTYAEMDENIRDLYEDTTIDRVLGNGNTTTKSLTVGNITITGDSSSVGAWVKLLDTSYTSDVASISIDGFFSSDYDRYVMYFYGFTSGGTDLHLRFNSNGIANTSSKYLSSATRLQLSPTAGAQNVSTRNDYYVDYIYMGTAPQIIDYENTGVNGEITFIDPNANISSEPKVITYKTNDGSSQHINYYNGTGTFFNDGQSNITKISGVTFFPIQGNIQMKKVILYGIKS